MKYRIDSPFCTPLHLVKYNNLEILFQDILKIVDKIVSIEQKERPFEIICNVIYFDTEYQVLIERIGE